MKTPRSRQILPSSGAIMSGVAALALAITAPSAHALFDGGIDPANLGKGDWIYFISQATNQLGGNVPSVTNIPSLMQYEKSKGMDYIVVKAGTGSTNFPSSSNPQFNSNLVYQAHAAGLKIFAYTRSDGNDVAGEIALANACYALGADGFVIDAEVEWESAAQGTNGPSKAMQLGSSIKTNNPTKFLAHAPLPYISLHSSFPYKEFGYWCDAVMPQCYWYDIGVTPAQMVADLDSEWRNWQNGLTGQWTNSIKPICPIGQADNAAMAAADITSFVNALAATANPACSGGYQSISWWRADLHTSAHWTAIGTSDVGNTPGTVNDLIIDNLSASVTGTWSSGTGATDKYASDYRYKGQGTGTAYLQFRPSIWTAGSYQVFEWHSQGSNRSTNVPHLVTYSGGSSTVYVNQKVNGGMWNSIGTFNFAAGVGGHVRVKDNFSDAGQLAMADAIKLVYVPPSAPTAPSGLAANAVSGSQINVSWNDNSSNEHSFVVARGTTSGGPYTDVQTLAPNSISYSDYALAPNTTYYYVVRAVNAGGANSSAQASATTLPELIIDNPAATVVGTWSTASSATDKYGSDYRYKSGGTGSAYLQFTPNISVAGTYQVFEWHAQGANRTTNAPYVITHSGGTVTVRANQQVNGGKWNLLGTYTFATGTSGYVRVQDNYADASQNVMADAIRFACIGATPSAPSAPGGLAASAVSQSQINLSWTDNSNNEDNFTVSRSTTSGGPYTDIAVLGANTTSYNNTGLSANTTYYYVVRASNGGGDSLNSNQASATTVPSVPAAPSGLSATTVSQTQINLSWTDNSSNETGFTIGRSTTSGGPYSDIATVGANVTSYSNTGLSANTTYYYVVRASNAGGSSANSAQASATTLPNPPAAPSGLSGVTISQTEIDLSWTDNSSNETSFILARSATAGGPYTDIATLAADTTAYANTGLAANTTYYYVVRAVNSGGASANSAESSSTTLPNAPAAPSGLTATVVSQTQINLNWVDNSSNETSFTVARSTTSGGPYSNVATVGANVTSYSDTGLTANTTYYYVVRAANAGGSSGNSSQASGTTLPNPPAAPSGLTATTVGSSQINLSWTDNSSNETGFTVARSTTSGGPYTDVATVGANVTSYSNTGLTANTTYYYVVRASNAGGNSANSAQASATTLPTAPAAPSGLTATALSSTSIKLTWTDNSSNESNFIVARSTVNGGPYTDIATLGANVTTYTNTSLSGSTTYYYVIRATNAGGDSANSAQASATTQPVADIIVDNPAAVMTGTWTVATSATDKYGADYRYKSQGTGAAYLTYRPTILVAGNYQVYEWHSQGSNRTTNAPVILSYNGGSRTNFVNQKVNGGSWVALGSAVNFAAGTNGYVRITDKFSDAGQIVISDAIKLVYVP